jgi:hypothetical protein
MRREPKPNEVLSLVIGMFERFRASPQNLFDLKETVRIEGGKPIARSYCVEGLMAMWMIGLGLVQFYDAEGNMLATLNLFHRTATEPMAV